METLPETQTVEQKVKHFLSRSLQDCELRDDDDIFAMGLVNSLFALQLVMFVEKTFQVKVEDDDLRLENFRSVNALTSLVNRLAA